MSCIAPLFDEAWAHGRRRRRLQRWLSLLCAVTAAAVAASALIPGGAGPASHGTKARRDAAAVAPPRALSRPPYLGVACRMGYAPTCDRVGLAVWLKRPAVSVTATIGGVPFALNARMQDVTGRHQPRRAFIGYLRRAGLGGRLHVSDAGSSHPPRPPVRLTIRYPSGTVITRLRVLVEPGWG